MSIIAFQPEFRPALPVVFGAKDYREFRAILIEMDRILVVSGIEHRLIGQCIASLKTPPSHRQLQRHAKTIRLALRYNILLGITGLSYRALSRQASDSHLFQWFTNTGFVDAVRPVSKSTMERFEKMFSAEVIAGLIHQLNRAAAEPVQARKLLYRETALRFDEIFADTTCVKANIHFPVDWILLRDASRTLINAIRLIRRRGLRHRIGSPEKLLRDMNKLCIEMAHTRKKPEAEKMRKQVFRRMKKLMKLIEGHAGNYHALLAERWIETGLSEIETQVVLDRIQRILDQLPQAVYQAHERIIGQRRLKNSDKILSLYETGVHVIVRGKAEAEVEFGNGLYLAEQADGLIVDWDFIQGQPSADSRLLSPSIRRITVEYGTPGSYTTDRGFNSQANDLILEELGVINATCPRSVYELQEKLADEGFCRLQKRRGATEGRIGIFKNAYLGKPLRSKGFKNRQIRIDWCILAHNLWKMGRIAAQQREEIETELAATG